MLAYQTIKNILLPLAWPSSTHSIEPDIKWELSPGDLLDVSFDFFKMLLNSFPSLKELDSLTDDLSVKKQIQYKN